jgi:hypothetical protein
MRRSYTKGVASITSAKWRLSMPQLTIESRLTSIDLRIPAPSSSGLRSHTSERAAFGLRCAALGWICARGSASRRSKG